MALIMCGSGSGGGFPATLSYRVGVQSGNVKSYTIIPKAIASSYDALTKVKVGTVNSTARFKSATDAELETLTSTSVIATFLTNGSTSLTDDTPVTITGSENLVFEFEGSGSWAVTDLVFS